MLKLICVELKLSVSLYSHLVLLFRESSLSRWRTFTCIATSTCSIGEIAQCRRRGETLHYPFRHHYLSFSSFTMLFWLHAILSRFFHRLLDLFTCQACHEFLAEPDYPDLRDIMSGSPLKTSPHQWVDSLTSVSGNTERNRPQDVRDTLLSSIEHLRQDTHELIVIEMQYKGVPRWYSLERFVGEDSPSSSPSFQLHVQSVLPLDFSPYADSAFLPGV